MTLQRVFASEHLYRDWCDKCQYAKPALPMAALLRTLTQYSQPAHAAAHACSDAMGGLLWLSHLFLQHRADRDRHQPPLKRRMRSCNMLRAAARASKPSKSPRRRRQAPRSGCTPSRTNCLARLALVGVSTLAPRAEWDPWAVTASMCMERICAAVARRFGWCRCAGADGAESPCWATPLPPFVPIELRGAVAAEIRLHFPWAAKAVPHLCEAAPS